MIKNFIERGTEIIRRYCFNQTPQKEEKKEHFPSSSLKAALSLLENQDIPVKEIMTQRADIRWIDLNKPLSKTLHDISRHPHRYYPVSRHDLDKIEGKFDFLVHGMALGKNTTFEITKYLTPLLYISPTLGCYDLLVKMKDTKHHMAIVVDEFGGVDGLVTLADIMLKIVAEMNLEPEAMFKSKISSKDQSIIVDGRMSLDQFESQFGTILNAEEKKEDKVETLGGLVLSLAGYVPARGEIISHPTGVQFEVIKSDARRVKRIRVRHIEKLSSLEM